MDSTEWLLFLCLFPAVEKLHLSGDVVRYITSVLEDNAEMAAEVLPALRLLWLDKDNCTEGDGPAGSIDQFLSSRRLSGLPVTVVNTEDEFIN